MFRYILFVLPTLVTLHFVTAFYVRLEKFAAVSMNTSWMIVENSAFTEKTFSLRMHLLQTIYQYRVLIKSHQRVGRQKRPSPFNWNLDMCQLLLNPLKYNFVIGTFLKSMAIGNNMAKKCPVPADFLYSVDNYELKADFFPKFFPPGRFIFNVTVFSGNMKIVNLEWILEINHQFLNYSYWGTKRVM